jgi:hypothetical protein
VQKSKAAVMAFQPRPFSWARVLIVHHIGTHLINSKSSVFDVRCGMWDEETSFAKTSDLISHIPIVSGDALLYLHFLSPLLIQPLFDRLDQERPDYCSIAENLGKTTAVFRGHKLAPGNSFRIGATTQSAPICWLRTYSYTIVKFFQG